MCNGGYTNPVTAIYKLKPAQINKIAWEQHSQEFASERNNLKERFSVLTTEHGSAY